MCPSPRTTRSRVLVILLVGLVGCGLPGLPGQGQEDEDSGEAGNWERPSFARKMLLVNVTPSEAFTEAAAALQLPTEAGAADAPTLDARVVAWMAQDKVTDAQAEVLGNYVRAGGSLLMTLSRRAGDQPTAPLWSILPSTTWNVWGGNSQRWDGPVEWWDPEMFGDAPADLQASWFYGNRPFHGVERGEARWERFQRPIFNMPFQPNHLFWSRPLANRDWRIRARAQHLFHEPLLITGKAGAGKVALLGSEVNALSGTGAQKFWHDVLAWLAAEDAPPLPEPSALQPDVQMNAADRVLEVNLHNPVRHPITVDVVTRFLTWEHALVGDVVQTVLIEPRGSHAARIPIPASDATSYQALAAQDELVARVGVIGALGHVVGEREVEVQLQPQTSLSLSVNEIRTVTYPADAVRPVDIPGLPNRLGLQVMEYAFPPGQTITATVEVSNGLRDLAPLATLINETNPTDGSVSTLVDGAVLGEGYATQDIETMGEWWGTSNTENSLVFSFAQPVTVAAVVLVGAGTTYRNYHWREPSGVKIELDGQVVTEDATVGDRFGAVNGRVDLRFPARTATDVRVRLTCGNDCVLGLLEILGSVDAPGQAVNGELTISLHVPRTNNATTLDRRNVTVGWGETLSYQIPVVLPADQSFEPLRLEATLGGYVQRVPLLALLPTRPLRGKEVEFPRSAVDRGFIVTRGFRNCFELGTGTAEMPNGWSNPDDLVWAYSHGLKEIWPRTGTQSARMYVSQSNLQHYSFPWRGFNSGADFWEQAVPGLLVQLKEHRNWATAEQVTLGFSDRWTYEPSGPMRSWSDMVAFDEWLQQERGKRLQGQTRTQLREEIDNQLGAEWETWRTQRYFTQLRFLRQSVEAEGKQLRISQQGFPLFAGAAGAEVGEIYRALADDNTWGMARNDIPLTSGRQLGTSAVMPALKMSSHLVWGYDVGVLNNAHWRHATGTTEPSRRHAYSRAWLGHLLPNGTYASVYQYGFNSNAGISYTMARNDYQELWRTAQRWALIEPQAPEGLGLVIGVDHLVNVVAVNGALTSAEHDRDQVANAHRFLQAAQVSVPFSASLTELPVQAGFAPIAVVNINYLSNGELDKVRQYADAGNPVVVVLQKDAKLGATAASLLGVDTDGRPTTGTVVASVGTAQVVQHGRFLFIPRAAHEMSDRTAAELGPVLRQHCGMRLTFPPGTAGYAFKSHGAVLVSLHDWYEQGRTAQLHWRSSATSLSAVSLNEHVALKTTKQADEWVIEVPLRPGDGELVWIREAP